MGKRRVLLVDDEPELVFTMAERLEIRGYDVDAVTSGQEALDRLSEATYDVAVVDVKMPGMGGQVVLGRASQDLPDLPVIMLTGHGSTEEFSGGACAYLFKPVSIEDLIETIEECAAKKG